MAVLGRGFWSVEKGARDEKEEDWKAMY